MNVCYILTGAASTSAASASAPSASTTSAAKRTFTAKQEERRVKRLKRVHEGAAPTEARFFYSNSGKQNNTLKRMQKQVLRRERKTEQQQKVERALLERKANSGLYWCCLRTDGNKDCNRGYRTLGRLRNHVKIGKHTMGISSSRVGKRGVAAEGLLSTVDRFKLLAADAQVGAAAIRDVREPEHFALNEEGTYCLVNGDVFEVPTVECGYANKGKRGAKKRYTTRQLEFLKWCYSQGVQDKAKKFTAEAAEKVMPLHGTSIGALRYPEESYWRTSPDGYPTFRLFELLDHWVIKPWFSQQKAGFEKTLATALSNATAQVDTQQVVDDHTIEDAD